MSNQLSVLIPKIHAFIRRYYTNRLLKGLFLGLFMLLLLIITLSSIEYLLWLPKNGRLALLILYLLGFIWILASYIIWPLYQLIFFRKQMSEDRAARLIGLHFSEIDDKLLNTLQLENLAIHQNQSDLLLATIESRNRELEHFRFADAIDFKSSLRFAPYLVLAALLFGILWFINPKIFKDSGNRIVRYNEAFVKPLPFEVFFAGDSLSSIQNEDYSFEITVKGDEIPSAFYIATNGGRQLMARQNVNKYNFTFKKPGRNIQFRVEGGDYQSQPVTLHVFPRPVILSYEAQIKPPNYTGLESVTERSKSSFYVAEGSEVKLDVFSRDTDNLTILSGDSLNFSPVRNENVWTHNFVLSKDTKLEIRSSNRWSEKLESFELNLKMIPDAFPEIIAEMVTEDLGRKFYFSGGITDDYGFTRLRFYYTIIDPETNEASREFQQEIGLENNRIRQSFFHAFFADSVNLAPGDRVEAYFKVWDNDRVNGAKSARSKPFTLEVPSYEKLDSLAQERESSLSEKMDQTKASAEQVKKDLEKLMKDLALKQEADWQDQKKLEDLLERQKQLQEDWQEMQEEQKKLNEFQKENELVDEDLLKKQEEINELFEEVASDEMKKLMEEIQKMMDELNKDQMQQMLQNMKMDNMKMEDMLDRNLNLLKQLKVEKDMRDLIKELEELGDEMLNEKEDGKGEEQENLEENKSAFDDMQKKLDSIRERNEELSKPMELENTDSIEEEIEQDMENAQSEQQQGEPQKSAKSKKSAGEKMKKMANMLQMSMEMSMKQQQMEDAHTMRILLENVLRSSLSQEDILMKLSEINRDDPSFLDLVKSQNELTDNFKVVEDSLRALAKRQPAIENFIFDELQSINYRIEDALNQLKESRLNQALSAQQFALMSMNNLALMLAESLENMENSMGMPSPMNAQGQPKPGQKPGQEQLKQMRQMQEQLGKMLQEMRDKAGKEQGKGKPGMSEQLARMAAQQEAIREKMQQYLNSLQAEGKLGESELKKIIEEMEQLEEDLVNKRVNQRLFERQKEIVSRMLESEKSEQKREQEEKRESNEFKGDNFGNFIDEIEYKRILREQQELLKLNPLELRPYYRSKNNEYFFRRNAKNTSIRYN